MSGKKVLLIESGQFIGGVIRSLFARQEQLIVIEASPTNTRELMKMVEKHRPEIIVLDDTVRVDYLTHLLRFMQASEDIRVVVLNTNSNRLDVYQKQKINVNQSADFFAVL